MVHWHFCSHTLLWREAFNLHNRKKMEGLRESGKIKFRMHVVTQALHKFHFRDERENSGQQVLRKLSLLVCLSGLEFVQ